MRHVHVAPMGDIIEHNLGKSSECPCNPRVEINEGCPMVIHDAMDGREPNTPTHITAKDPKTTGWGVYDTDTY